MLSITMARGDIHIVRFQVYDETTGEICETDFTEIYMSVKKYLNDRDVLFQKRLSAGGIEKLGPGDYQIKIEASDTESLDFKKQYPFDIELVYENEIKQTTCGELILTPEVTCVWNEVT